MLRSFPRAAALVAALCLAPAAHAASVVIWPVNPTIARDARAAAIWIDNRGAAPVTMQVRALAWDQANAEDRYGPQSDVVVSPPVLTIEAGHRQLVRVIRLGTPGQAPERSYRLLIDELPPPAAAADGPGATTRLSVQMRYSIPLFTYGDQGQEAKPTLTSHVMVAGPRRFLVLANTGSHHARLMDLRVMIGGHPTTLIAGLMGYVLPGATMRWPLPADVPAGPLVVGVNGQDVTLGGTV